MKQLSFTNSLGESIVFKVGSPFAMNNPTGLGDVGTQIQTQKAPFQDGSTFIDAVMAERDISFDVVIKGDNDTEISERRTLLARVFNPKLGLGVLRYQYGDIIREISVVPDHVPTFPAGSDNRGKRHQTALIDLLAPDPYWRTLNMETEPTFEPLFQFAFEGDFQMGVQRDERIIVNGGDVLAPLVIEFHGPAVNPIVTNETTGEFIKIKQTLGANEIMRIDTTDGNKSVVFVDDDGTERNVFNWIDLNSTFFKLVLGENAITYTADNDIQGAVVNFYYQERYQAI